MNENDVVHVKIDNVAKYFFGNWLDKDLDLFAPIVTPPLEHAYFSYKFVYDKDFLPRIRDWCEFVIVEVVAHEIAEEDRPIWGCRWFVQNHLWVKPPFGKESKHVATTHAFVREDGSLAGYDDKHMLQGDGIRLAMELSPLEDEPMYYPFEETLSVLVAPVLAATTFMHSKNVELIDEPLSRQRRRMLERKGGIRYKVLDIEPFKQQVRRETQPGESQIQRALHICRGHFATYTDDAPLFGKVTGTFWKPMHVRGNKAAGEVVKDYNIKLDD